MTTTIGMRRRTASLITAVAFAASGAFVFASASPATADEHNQWVYVCKYVGKPGVDERLQTGQNPILVSVNSVAEPIVVGAPFNDAQGRSVVIGFGEPGGGQAGEPAPECPPVLPPPPTETTTPPTETTTPPTETTTPPTETTTPPTETTTPPTETTTPPTETTTPPTTPGAGGGVTPGPGAPDTGGGPAGGTGDSSPVNGLVGTGLLMGAAGILTAEALRRRRENADS
ncbi:hypothetical protein [Intrasporangium sp. DVR]|uniref:hypothetical protein n=1 Tax=Intrasporangium sp. DVR TaxID=3127867 RepID=UPI00313A6428